MSVFKKMVIAAVLLISFCSYSFGQRIDFNMSGRSVSEGTEPGFLPWAFGRVVSASEKFRTADGDTINITVSAAPGLPYGNGVRSFYWKKGVVTNGYKLLGDACAVIQLTNPANSNDFTEVAGRSGVQFVITGLKKGKHSLMAYHNMVDGYTGEIVPIDVVVDGATLASNIQQTIQATKKTEAGYSYVTFSANGTDAVTVQYVSRPAEGKTYAWQGAVINAMVFDEADPMTTASDPSPANLDYHVDADNGSYTLSWKSALTAVKHHLLFGTASGQLNEITAQKDTFYTMKSLDNLHTYYWRIDEEDAAGKIYKGDEWSFRPRHLAFPEAEGYGRYATGGRLGAVYHVTKLVNDNLPGSIGYGLTEMEGPRTIVFDVSGVIDMKFSAVFVDANVTIAGQTAPGKGICLYHSNTNIGSDDICRFVRARRGGGDTGNAMGITGANHAIIDHTSLSWGTDETFSSRNAHNVTFQNSMIAEALGIAHHKNYAEGVNHGFAATIGGDIATFSHNLLVDCNGRNWSLGGGLDGDGYASGRLDIFNNVCYNWHGRTTDGGAHEVNFVGNYYKEGPACNKTVLLKADLENIGLGTQSYYVSGNVRDNQDGTLTDDKEGDTYTYLLYEGKVLDWTVWADKPFFPSYATVQPARDAYKKVLSDVGANMPVFDNHDQRMIRETRDRSYTYVGSLSGIKGEIDDESDCGGLEIYPESQRDTNFDTDQDGIPNWFETLKGTDVNTDNHLSDNDKDGYTDLEDYLNWMAQPHVMMAADAKTQISLKALFAGYTKTPNYTYTGGEKLTLGIINDTTLTIAAPTAYQGLQTLRLTVKDADGSTLTKIFNVAVSDAAQSTAVDNLEDMNAEIREYQIFTTEGKLLRTVDVQNRKTIADLEFFGLAKGLYVVKAIDSRHRIHSYKILK